MRYVRQKNLINQDLLKTKSVAVAGIGGLGSPAAAYLSLAGVGKLILIDKDVVDESNLNRQFLFKKADIGEPKTDIAKRRLSEMNPDVEIIARNSLDISGADLVLDCLDNWESRQELWERAFAKKIPVVHGAVNEWSGQVAVLLSDKDAQIFRNKSEGSCQIIGAVAGVVGSQMALEAIQILSGKKPSPNLKALTSKGFEEFRFKKSPDWTHILIRFAEVWTKSKTTKHKMLGVLSKNIERAVGVRPKIKGHRLILPYLDAAPLNFVFGIKTYSPAVFVEHENLEQAFLEFASQTVKGSFRVSVQRVWKDFPKKSPQLGRELGAIASQFGPVDLVNYDTELCVEIHKDGAYLFTEKVKGPGGLPYGVEGKVLALFSGGIDSPVAAWMLAKRGAELELLFLNPLGDSLESEVYRVYSSVKKWFSESTLWVADISKDFAQIRERIPEGNRQTIYKRRIYRIAEHAARELGCKAIITGESLGQVSSQTLESLNAIDSVSQLPVFRPLIGLDKDEIVSIAKKIGSYESSSKISEFCKLESHSNAHPNREDIDAVESLLDLSFPEVRIAKTTEIESLLPNNESDFEVVFLSDLPSKFDKNKRYLFVCKSGNMAKEQALKLRKEGFEAYALSEKEARKRGLL